MKRSAIALTAIILGILEPPSISRADYLQCIRAPLAVGESFITRGGRTETVSKVANVFYNSDVVGFVYVNTRGELFAQARSGMPVEDQRIIQVRQLPSHHTGDRYVYSEIVPIRVNPWRDLIVRFCTGRHQ